MEKYLFIHINKCGGTSLKKALKYKKNVLIPKNDDLVEYSNNENWKSYKKFTIVRHPINRIQSLQGMLIKLFNIHKSIDQILDLVEDENLSYYHDFSKPYIAESIGDSFIKRHALPISHVHYQIIKNNQLNIDKYWKLEELDKKVEEIKIFLKLDNLFIPKINTSFTEKPKLSKHEIQRIESIYKKDIDVFY